MALKVDGARRLLNVSPDEMSDDDLRRALVTYVDDLSDPDADAEEVERRVRHFTWVLDHSQLG